MQIIIGVTCVSVEACASVWAFNAATVADAELASWSAESFKFVVTNSLGLESGRGDARSTNL